MNSLKGSTAAGKVPLAGKEPVPESAEDVEKEIMSILQGSALFLDLEAEDRQRLVKRLVSLVCG